MENFNKIISFVLGLVVVVVLLIILTGRFNLRERFLPLRDANRTTVTPTPQPVAKKNGATPTPAKAATSTQPGHTGTYNYHSYKGGTIQSNRTGAVTTIPKTGPDLLLPLVFSALAGGIYLRRKE